MFYKKIELKKVSKKCEKKSAKINTPFWLVAKKKKQENMRLYSFTKAIGIHEQPANEKNLMNSLPMEKF
jgi:hypothetical protein